MGLSNIYGVPGLAKRSQAMLIDGKAIASAEREDVARGVDQFVATKGRKPALATILIGDDPASEVYVASKIRACKEVGIASVHHHLQTTIEAREVLELIDTLNHDPAISGILCQLPVPGHLDASALTNRIDPAKDVDGLTVANAGRLALGVSGLRPCTPSGVLRLIAEANVDLRGKRAVVIGRSNLFGKPMAQMLTAADATVTLCHRHTIDLPDCCREAEVLIAAVGQPEMVRADWVRPGAIVIDVGINRGDSGLVGDVEFEGVLGVAAAVTPVPGGVGPMTIACLLRNTLIAAKGPFSP